MPTAVIFDMDGVLVDSEAVWDDVRKRFVEEKGGHWHESAQRDMMGMSSVEWSRYVRDQLGVEMDPEEISREVADRVADVYREKLPLLPGAVEAVKSLAEEWPLGLASSSNRHVIDLVLELAGIADAFAVTVSSEEVGGRQAGAGRLPRGGEAAGERGARLRGGRGLDQRHPLSARRRHGRDSGPEPGLPAGAGCARTGDVTLKSLTEVTPKTVRQLR